MAWCQSLCPALGTPLCILRTESLVFIGGSLRHKDQATLLWYSRDNVRHTGLERGCHCSSAWSWGNEALLLLCSVDDPHFPAAQLKCLLLTWMAPRRRCKCFLALSWVTLRYSSPSFRGSSGGVHPCCPLITVSSCNIYSCTFIAS